LILSIFNSQKRYNLIVSEKELEFQKNHNATLQSLVDSLRTFKHDYNNTLATLYGYVQLNDIKSLKRMFKEILEESKEISTLDKLNPNLIKDPNIYGLVTLKYQTCLNKNVGMEIDVFGELENVNIKIFDLTRILGIFLDNAIEAAAGSKERKIHLEIKENKENIIIKISNTYSDKAISIEKIYEKGVSSKGKNRGLGLYKVKEIVKKYKNVKLNTITEKDWFIQELIISNRV
jgi:two-component system sensor histidine kinase AgrC